MATLALDENINRADLTDFEIDKVLRRMDERAGAINHNCVRLRLGSRPDQS